VKSPELQGEGTGSIYTWKVPWGAALARTRDDEKWTDLHGQVGKTVRGTGQCCGPHASAGSSSSACLTLISLSVFTKKKVVKSHKIHFWRVGRKVPKEVTYSLFWIEVSGMSTRICLLGTKEKRIPMHQELLA